MLKNTRKITGIENTSLFKKSLSLICWSILVGLFVSADFINLLNISYLIWPGESFRSLQLGLMISVRLWIDGISAVFWGYLVDKFNRKKIFSFTSLFTGILIIFNGFLPVGGGDSDYLKWLYLRASIGFFMSAGGPAIHSLASDLFKKEERSQYFGFEMIAWASAEVFGMILSAFLFEMGNWRQYYIGVGFLYLIFSSFMMFKFKEPKRGIQEKYLRDILSNEEVVYNYKITKETLKNTLFSKTNTLILIEGLFTNIFFGILNLVLLPYIQSPPHNISPSNTGLFVLIFGVPGALFGTLYFARISDKFGSKNIKNRITLIIISISLAFLTFFFFFIIPLPSLTPEEGSTFQIIFDYPIFWLMGLILFSSRIVFSVFSTNQLPLIQEINLPEAQGTIRSWNHLVEIAGYGSGPVIAGALLEASNNNYLSAVLNSIWIVIPGLLFWFFTYKTINKDRDNIKEILNNRAIELESISKKKYPKKC